VCPSPRNVPDEILKEVARNGGVVMVNFYSGFLVADAARMVADARRELKARHPDPAAYEKALDEWFATHTLPRGTVADVADHIDHIVPGRRHRPRRPRAATTTASSSPPSAWRTSRASRA
jgi:membrane dipeptidase